MIAICILLAMSGGSASSDLATELVPFPTEHDTDDDLADVGSAPVSASGGDPDDIGSVPASGGDPDDSTTVPASGGNPDDSTSVPASGVDPDDSTSGPASGDGPEDSTPSSVSASDSIEGDPTPVAVPVIDLNESGSTRTPVDGSDSSDESAPSDVSGDMEDSDGSVASPPPIVDPSSDVVTPSPISDTEVMWNVVLCCITEEQCKNSAKVVQDTLQTSTVVTATCTAVEKTTIERRLPAIMEGTWDIKYTIVARKDEATKIKDTLNEETTKQKIMTTLEGQTGEKFQKFEPEIAICELPVGSPKSSGGGLSGGAIAGLVAGSLLGVALICSGIYDYRHDSGPSNYVKETYLRMSAKEESTDQ